MADRILRPFHSRFVDLSGRRFGKLVVDDISHRLRDRRGDVRVFWRCLCDCGNETAVRSSSLIDGTTTSCGCRRFQNRQRLRHGECTGGTETPEYRVWQSMKKRCLNPRNISYPNYGGRGIRVCDGWLTFENFLADMGRKPTKQHQLDRINPNGHYEPSNCRWTKVLAQANNTRRNVFIIVRGERLTVAQAARKFGVKSALIRKRLYRGWSTVDAVFTPSGERPA